MRYFMGDFIERSKLIGGACFYVVSGGMVHFRHFLLN